MRGTIVENTHGALFWVGRVYWAEHKGVPVACVELHSMDGRHRIEEAPPVGVPFAMFVAGFERVFAPAHPSPPECECGNPDPGDQCEACGRGRDWGDVQQARAEARLAFEADRIDRLEYGGVE